VLQNPPLTIHKHVGGNYKNRAKKDDYLKIEKIVIFAK